MYPLVTRKTGFIPFGVAILMIIFGYTPLHAATPLGSPVEFSGSETLIDFEGIPLNDEVIQISDVVFQLVGTQNDGMGAGAQQGTFTREFGPQGPGFIDPYPGTNFFQPPAPKLRLTFDNPINRLGFEMRSNLSNIEIVVQCIVNGTVVDEFNFPGPTDFNFRFYAFESTEPFDEVIIGPVDNGGWGLDNLRYESISTVPTYACAGFQPPLDLGPVSVMRRRALPLRAQFFDNTGNLVDPASIVSRPVMQVTFAAEFDGTPIDITDEVLPAWRAHNGNQFRRSGDTWKFNLQTRLMSAPGKYTLRMVSGDPDEYLIDPGCEVDFQRLGQ